MVLMESVTQINRKKNICIQVSWLIALLLRLFMENTMPECYTTVKKKTKWTISSIKLHVLDEPYRKAYQQSVSIC